MNSLQRQLITALRKALAGGKPVVPEAGRLLWSFFVELSATRSYSMTGPNPISYAEIEAWARLHRWPLEPSHIGSLRAMDDAWLEHAQSRAGKGGKTPFPRSSGQAISPAAFDAVFG